MMQNPELQYDVFINHRGTDVKNSLASLIYNHLKSKESTLRVFLDQKEIPYGVDFATAIETAIQSSSVHIAIFSERYAESSWCLDELDLILRSKRPLIPVFCDVEPWALRRIDKGCFQKAFEKHEGREPVEKTKRWKDALSQASFLQGMPFKTKENDYWDFVEKIVGIVLKKLKQGSLVVAKYPVRLEQAAEAFPAEVFPTSASELEDLKVCQEFITEEFALAHGPDDDRPDLTELFEADGPAVSELFELNDNGPAISEMFEPDEDGPAWRDLFKPDKDGPVSK